MTAGINFARAQHAQITLLIGSGVVAAAQIGKAIVSVPLIRQEIAVGFDRAGFLIAIFATLGATTGIGLGAAVTQFGLRRALIGGMSLISLGNVIGALANGENMLFLARLVEGVGFFGVVLAIPSMLARIVVPIRRDVVMALWSAYMPAGIMLMLFAGPVLAHLGWRNLWLANSALAALVGLILVRYAPVFSGSPDAAPASALRSAQEMLKQASRVLGSGSCWMIAAAFFAYSCQIFSLSFALPSLLVSEHAISLAAAATLSALALAASTLGHLASGLVLRLGLPIWLNLAIPFAFFAVADVVIFAGGLPAPVVAAAAALALCVGGLAPGALYASVPRIAPCPEALPPTIGLVQQASNLGQFAGPLALGLWVEHFGWHSLPAIATPAAVVGFLLALGIRVALSDRRASIPRKVSRADPRPSREHRPANDRHQWSATTRLGPERERSAG